MKSGSAILVLPSSVTPSKLAPNPVPSWLPQVLGSHLGRFLTSQQAGPSSSPENTYPTGVPSRPPSPHAAGAREQKRPPGFRRAEQEGHPPALFPGYSTGGRKQLAQKLPGKDRPRGFPLDPGCSFLPRTWNPFPKPSDPRSSSSSVEASDLRPSPL